ncbi:chemotaxis-specific protein-glutamate methyltransferase CheB [Anoxynatronum buryatiense]|uniref:Protein-glutamate methylesterase/protein-glutamine glutaminase n=1 Tax=Anoxynatronum buryatiense TaxID=489973 RepID=A0AA46AIE3_9CLOT|nr:chemotaxis-specific protein-glutamate methyltransferase CheB [Anoxynatronum buryatiense]SMP48036.1 two-component system, chemotaxis family, response regulator CheB [Anoxynatronum buryatiense]
MAKLKALVVDDTIIYRKILSQAVEDTGLCEVSKTAPNGAIALDWLKQRPFDVVLLDVFMPEMDGLETLKKIKMDYPHIDVIMISSDGSESVKNTMKALELGALEFILKPTGGDANHNIASITRMLKILFAQIQIRQMSRRTTDGESHLNATRLSEPRKVPRQLAIQQPTNNQKRSWSQADMVLIASSTGGPVALERLLSSIPHEFNIPLLIVQHMPKHFTRVLAQTLNHKTHLEVMEAENEMEMNASSAIIAAGGLHMSVVQSGGKRKVQLLDTAYVNGVKPAADVLFNSIAESCQGQRVLVIILTGMGSDGTAGIARMQESCEVYCITQNEETCVVYGMPRSVEEAGFSDESLPIDQIAERIAAFGSRRR